MNGSDQLVVYNFNGIESLEIEADANTDIVFGRNNEIDSSTDSVSSANEGNHIRVGPTNKIVLNPLKSTIKSLEFARPSYAIINYKAVSSLELKGYINTNEE